MIRQAVVIGAAGTIGSAIATAFVTEGWGATGVDIRGGGEMSARISHQPSAAAANHPLTPGAVAHSSTSTCLGTPSSDSLREAPGLSGPSQPRDEVGEKSGLACDATNPSQVEALAASLPRVDVLVYAAGVIEPEWLDELTPAAFTAQFQSNVLGAALVVKALRPQLALARGQVIFISSVSARMGFDGLAFYCASKAALEGLMRGLVPELGASGIRINCIAPTNVESEMLRREVTMRAQRTGLQPDAIQRRAEADQPLPRMAEAAEIARLCVALACGNFPTMTGSVIALDGGLSTARPA